MVTRISARAKAVVLGILIGVLVLISAVTVTSLMGTDTATSKPAMTEDAAKTEVRRFAGKPEMLLENDETNESRSFGRDVYHLVDKSSKAVYDVDKATGNVVGAFYPVVGKGGGQGIKENQAIARAKAFATKNGLKVPISEATVTSIGMGDSDMGVYLVTWQEVAKGIRLPVVLQVGVDANSGDVVSFTSSDADVLPDLSPKVSRDEAISQGRAKVDFAATRTEANLDVWPVNGQMRLRWTVDLYGSTDLDGDLAVVRTAEVTIDAKSGEVLDVTSR